MPDSALSAQGCIGCRSGRAACARMRRMRGPLVIAGSPLQDLRVARPGEAVGGRQARLVGSPADPRALARLLAGCAADGLVVAARGAASKIDWGPLPARLDVLLDLAQLVGPVEHE